MLLSLPFIVIMNQVFTFQYNQNHAIPQVSRMQFLWDANGICLYNHE
uniref:Uncharacterized protein n=1 Tax=Dulem virus 42 TaxID=3145760 RepID=A0AAU8B7K2_9CAUD